MSPKLTAWIRELCIQSGKKQDFLDAFVNRLANYPDIIEELDYYRRTGDFLADVEIAGCTVIDIMVWQIDHFKSHMDWGEYDMQENPACMVLMAFDTLLQMKETPQSYLNAMQSETGTDYVGKF